LKIRSIALFARAALAQAPALREVPAQALPDTVLPMAARNTT